MSVFKLKFVVQFNCGPVLLEDN
uniref:Uncharacterized protein n=1 Tax=Anguilla anguilla TaxID=7936 RepID=A0A0E9RPG0_ANGAN